MSEYAPGTFQFAEQIMDMNVAEARRGAEAQRLHRRARADRASGQRLHFRALAWLGQRLTSWGVRLQERYSTEGSSPVPQSA